VTRSHLPLKLVLTIAYILYFRFILLVDTGSHSQLPGVTSSLNEFIKEHERKESSLGLTLRTAQFLKEHEGLKLSNPDQRI
jgi:hypothetical protein